MKISPLTLNNQNTITTIDAHTAGEPLRIIIDGFPDIEGNTMLLKRRFIAQHYDHLRRFLMLEPRGHADMYGALVTEPVSDQADFGVIFMHNEGYSSMCGHGIIALVTALVKTGNINLSQNSKRTIKIDSPAGLITAYVEDNAGKCLVSFDCVPAFVEKLNLTIQTENFGNIACDIAFGGAYYAYIDADKLNLPIHTENLHQFIELAKELKVKINQSYSIQHPMEADLSFLYGCIFTSKHSLAGHHSMHLCIFADGQVDRSPTGTGVSGRIALLTAKKEIAFNTKITIDSIINTSMTVSAQHSQLFANKEAVIPNVSGDAFITGQHQFVLDPTDKLQTGFMIR